MIGGIYSGLFTPTEAAAIAAVYAFVISVFIYKDLKISEVPRVLLNSAAMSSMLLYIITNAVLFSFLMTSEQIPQAMAAWMTSQGFGLVVFLLLVNVILLAAGNFMDPSAIVLIMAPILYPVAVQLGVNPIHLGILMAVNMEVGMCHPPVGLNLYVASGIAKMGITELTVAVWPWLLTMIGFLVLVTYWPPLSLWLPHLLHAACNLERCDQLWSRPRDGESLPGRDTESGVDFDWLDKRSMDPVGYKRINKRTGKEIERENIVKGVKADNGEYVVLTDDEIKAAYPRTTQTIEIEGFVRAAEIPFVYLEKPYYSNLPTSPGAALRGAARRWPRRGSSGSRAS